MTFHRAAASLGFFAFLTIGTFSAGAAHADGTAQSVTPQTVTRIAKVAGSVVQATVHSMDKASSAAPSDQEDIAAVCITSGNDAAQCGQSATLAHVNCRGAKQPADAVTNSDACHEGQLAHAQHVALCDADDIGLSGCLSKYAKALVRHPGVAEKAYQFTVRRDDKNLPDITVLVTAKQSEQDAAQMALDSMTSATTASSQ